MTGETSSSTADTANPNTATQDTTQVLQQAQLTDEQKRDIENYIRDRFVNIFDYVFDKIPGTDDYFKWDEQELLFGLKNEAAANTVKGFTLKFLCGEKGFQQRFVKSGEEYKHFVGHGLIPHHIFYDSHSLKLTNIDFNLLHDKISSGQFQDEELEEKTLRNYYLEATTLFVRASTHTYTPYIRIDDFLVIDRFLAESVDSVRKADSTRNDIVGEWGKIKKNIEEKKQELNDLYQNVEVYPCPREVVLSVVPVLDALITLLEEQNVLTKELTEIAKVIAPETAQLLSTVAKENPKSQVGGGTDNPSQISGQLDAEKSKSRIFIKVVLLTLSALALGAAQALLFNTPELAPWLLWLAKVIGITSLVTAPTLGFILLGVGAVMLLSGVLLQSRNKLTESADSALQNVVTTPQVRSNKARILDATVLLLSALSLAASDIILFQAPYAAPLLIGAAKAVGIASLVSAPTLGLILIAVGSTLLLIGTLIKMRSKIDIPAPSRGEVGAGSAPTVSRNSATRVMTDALSNYAATFGWVCV